MAFIDGTFGGPYTPTGRMRMGSVSKWGEVPDSSPGVTVRHFDSAGGEVPGRTISLGIGRLADRPTHDGDHLGSCVTPVYRGIS